MKTRMTNRRGTVDKHQSLPKNGTAKIAVCTLLLYAVICCTACGANGSDSDSGTNDTESGAQQPDEATDSSLAQSDENADQSNDEADSATTNDTSVSIGKSNIDIQMQTEENNKSTEDGTVYFYKSAIYPVVTMEGNAKAADKINADIRSRVDSFHANKEVEDMAEEMLQYFEEEDNDYPLIGYSAGLTYKTVRADSNVISFTLTYDSFSGGAHGNYTMQGANYSAKTGDLISFSDLSDDPAAFREDTLSYNQKLAETDSYAERMFSADDITNGTLESVLYADNAWYLSTSGLVFISDPYALGPYAAGIIEFIIPYRDLADMGFKESYTYSDRFVMKMQPHETYTADLNGDGEEDTILSYSEDVANEDGTYDPRPHLIINDTDMSVDSAAETQESLWHYAVWAEPALYDLNPDDTYIELVFTSWESDSEEGTAGYYSHFYRYTEDHTLVYLGSVTGDINDPTVDVTLLLSDMQ
ncbi:MAG: DUF3298 and DUF4163 domain-containing protein [Lachnospiraceae bacterium]|nr:DUF3298 and DUF4163 domain-containing protein [Lachnospiraceae bacterium]